MGHKYRMRRHPTKAESQFKREVLNVLKGCGIKFESQRIIWEIKSPGDKKAYILDFYLPDLKIAIEIDGTSHKGKRAQEYDAIRDSLCAKKGIKVIRFSNDEVGAPESCLRQMYKEIEAWQERNRARSSKATFQTLNRDEELRLQKEFIEKNGIKYLPSIGKNRAPICNGG